MDRHPDPLPLLARVMTDDLDGALVEEGQDDDVARRDRAVGADDGAVADLVGGGLGVGRVAAHDLDGVTAAGCAVADGGGHVAGADDGDGAHERFLFCEGWSD